MESLEPLSNFSLRVALFTHLQKLVYKEPNLKELIVKEVRERFIIKKEIKGNKCYFMYVCVSQKLGMMTFFFLFPSNIL